VKHASVKEPISPYTIYNDCRPSRSIGGMIEIIFILERDKYFLERKQHINRPCLNLEPRQEVDDCA